MAGASSLLAGGRAWPLTNSFLKAVVCSSCLIILFPPVGYATLQYAEQTRKACETCHGDPAGGGELTGEGRRFQAELRGGVLTTADTTLLRLVRLVAGYLHLLTTILWFGTILYVHLVLKPAYAARGLPRGEVRVGLISMGNMAVTGFTLVFFRVPSLEALFRTRFGILLIVKVALFLFMLASALTVVRFIGPRLRQRAVAKVSGEKQDLTLDELAEFTGKQGRPAYIGYRGRIYDVARGRWWIEGMHAGRHEAGRDLTDMLPQAPHGEENVLRMPLVGRLVASPQARPRAPEERVFYFMAYLNLVVALGIVLIVAHWRWW
jgi:predicted heme/steroid binding protein